MEATIVLHQFPSSHFNEKARWALDWKALSHRREHYLPGPHASKIKKLTGQTSTPVVEIDGEVTFGSARIIDIIEQRYPDRSLYPQDAEAKKRALEIQERFDREVGPAVRAAVFSVMVYEPGYMTKVFGHPHPLPTRLVYRSIFPLAKNKVIQAYGIDQPERVEAALRTTDEAFDFVAEESAATGHLVGRLLHRRRPDLCRPVGSRSGAGSPGHGATAAHPAQGDRAALSLE